MSEECLYCQEYKETPPFQINWIQCDVCSEWFHIHCLRLSQQQVSRIFKYHCPQCSTKHGESELKRTSRRKRQKIDYVALNDGEVENSVLKNHPHIERFKNWGNSGDNDGDDVGEIIVLSGEELTVEYALRTRLPRPVKIPSEKTQGLGLKVPNFDIDELVESMGSDAHVEVMDVLTQNGTRHSWELSEWRDYFKCKNEDRTRVYNVLSLEISDCDIGERIKRPKYVEQIDLVDKCWPNGNFGMKPKVTKYCLMGVTNSYTDFHLDFAGTSVYYTVLYGRKQFMFFPPSDLNLKRYVDWIIDVDKSKEFLGDLGLENGIKVSLNPGDVLIIPSGWIHAVYTPMDTMVIGGNFLTSFNISEQLKIIDIEIRTKVDKRYKFPNFSKLMWLTAFKILNQELKIDKDVDSKGSKELLNYLQNQLKRKDEKGFKESIPVKYIGRGKRFIDNFEKFLNQWDMKRLDLEENKIKNEENIDDKIKNGYD